MSAKLAELTALLEEIRGGPDVLLDFVPKLSPKFMRPSHLRPVADLLARVDAGEQVFGAVSVPPRHSKTELLKHAICWLLKRHPEWTIAYVSHGIDFACEQSAKTLDLARSTPGLTLRKAHQRAARWFTAAGGGVIATGIGGSIVGRGCNLLIIDDPHKDRAEAESETIRQKTIDWFRGTSGTRVEPGGSIICVHTRWHGDDLIGTLIGPDEELRFETVNLPAINDRGEALWPDRWPVAELAKKRKIVHEYDWWSQYQGAPRPRGGELFQEPARYQYPEDANVSGAVILVACDPAATAKTHADRSAVVVLAAKGKGDAMSADVVDVWTGQVTIPHLCAKLREFAKNWQSPIFVEAVGAFKAVGQILRDTDPHLRIVDVLPQGDKFTRALPVAAAWNAGRIRVPTGPNAPAWVTKFIAEITRFSGLGDKNDDQVDATVMAWTALLDLIGAPSRGVVEAKDLPFG